LCCTFLLGDKAKQGEAPLTPPYALGENTKRGDWDDLGEHHARQKPSPSESETWYRAVRFCLATTPSRAIGPLTPPYALGENTKRGDWDDLGEHHEKQKFCKFTTWIFND
jgi:hypothetical protein